MPAPAALAAGSALHHYPLAVVTASLSCVDMEQMLARNHIAWVHRMLLCRQADVPAAGRGGVVRYRQRGLRCGLAHPAKGKLA